MEDDTKWHEDEEGLLLLQHAEQRDDAHAEAKQQPLDEGLDAQQELDEPLDE